MRCITLDMIDHVKQNTQVELAMFDVNYLFQNMLLFYVRLMWYANIPAIAKFEGNEKALKFLRSKANFGISERFL